MSAAPQRATFRSWLGAQADRDDPVGDLARDATDDRCWTGVGWRSLASHVLNVHDAGRQVAETLHRARDEYRRWWSGGAA